MKFFKLDQNFSAAMNSILFRYVVIFIIPQFKMPWLRYAFVVLLSIYVSSQNFDPWSYKIGELYLTDVTKLFVAKTVTEKLSRLLSFFIVRSFIRICLYLVLPVYYDTSDSPILLPSYPRDQPCYVPTGSVLLRTEGISLISSLTPNGREEQLKRPNFVAAQKGIYCCCCAYWKLQAPQLFNRTRKFFLCWVGRLNSFLKKSKCWNFFSKN